MIECITFFGKKKLVDEGRVFFRPSVYGVIKSGDEIIVAKTIHAEKYSLPGGGIDEGELIEEGLLREILEETGLRVKIEKFLHFNENNFYYDPDDEAMNSYQYFFLCSVISGDLAKGEGVNDVIALDPEWVKIDHLNTENFQGIEMGVLPIIKGLLNESD